MRVVLVLTWNTDDQFEGMEYAVSQFLTTWQDADTVCVSNDAQLASASTQGEDRFLRERFPFSDTV